MIQPAEIQLYLRKVLGADATLLNIKALGEEEHDTGISNLLYLEVQIGCQTKPLILRRPASTVYNTEQLSDRAYTVLQAYQLYQHTPQHPRSLDVAIIHADGTLNSIPSNAEFVLLQEFGQGELYFHSLMQTLKLDEPSRLEERRAVVLAEYLLKLHAQTRDERSIYQRSLRDVVAGGAGAMGIIGSYAKELRDTYHDALNDVLCGFISHAWKLDLSPSNRLCRIHGDFHPLNILFDKETELTVIDASGIGWGDAAFDVGILFMNYYALYNRTEQLSSPSGKRLAARFLQTYTAGCDDLAGLYQVLPLSLARGALIMATTNFFPHRSMAERGRLIQLARDILSAGVFSPNLFSLYDS